MADAAQIAESYINGNKKWCRDQVNESDNPVDLVLELVAELGLAYGYEMALVRVHGMMQAD